MMAQIRAQMRPACRAFRVRACATLAVLLLGGFGSSASLAGDFAGRPVQAALTEIAGDELRLIYNDEIVPPALKVLAEPAPASPKAMVTEILAAHGLALSELRPALYAIVRAGQGDGAMLSSPGAGPAFVAPSPLPDLVVTTSRYELRYDAQGSFTHVGEALVQNLPKAADETLRVLHRLPGAASTGVSAPPNVRGGEQGEILYLLDGLQLYEPFHGKDFFNIVSIFDSRFVSGIDVFTGGYTADYGDRMSGVVSIQPLVVPEDNEFELGINLFHLSALGAGRFADGRGSWLASFRRSNLDELADLSNTDFGEAKYYDMLLGVGYELTPATRLGLHYLRSGDDIAVNDSARTETASARYRNDYVWGFVEHDWTGRLSSRLQLSVTDVENERDGLIDEPGQRSGQLFDRRGFRFGSMKLDFSWQAGPWSVRWGAEGRSLQANYRYASEVAIAADVSFPGSPPTTRDIDLAPAPDGYQVSAYTSGRYEFGDRWSAELGMRWDDQDYNGIDDSDQWSPRVNLNFALTDQTQLRLAWGRFHQTQGIHELQVEDGIDQFFPVQSADHFVLGVDQLLPADMTLRVEAYQKNFADPRPRFENLFDPLTLLPELQPDRIRILPESARARGVELSLAGDPDGPWWWRANYAWSRITDRIDGRDIARSWDQRHAFNLTVGWSGDRWDVTLAGTYHTGWPTTPVSLVAGEVVVGARNSERFEAFRSIDLRVARSFDLGRTQLQVFGEVTNLLLFENPCCVEYSVVADGAGEPSLRTEFDYWPRIVPNLGLYWRF
jgi:outer membrane receptor protein involved in Fe transport